MAALEPPRWSCLHERLARNTRDCHRMAERAFDVSLAFSSLENYRDLLGNLWAVHSTYEERLGILDFHSVGIDFASCRRAEWLSEDLAVLGGDCSKNRGPPSVIETLEHALGSLYVLEGSSLGGQVLLREALRLPGISIAHGARFLYGHGPRTGERWNTFLDTLNRFAPEGIAATAIEQGAIDTFNDFGAALQRRNGETASEPVAEVVLPFSTAVKDEAGKNAQLARPVAQ